jgi:hypothetical protein
VEWKSEGHANRKLEPEMVFPGFSDIVKVMQEEKRSAPDLPPLRLDRQGLTAPGSQRWERKRDAGGASRDRIA